MDLVPSPSLSFSLSVSLAASMYYEQWNSSVAMRTENLQPDRKVEPVVKENGWSRSKDDKD